MRFAYKGVFLRRLMGKESSLTEKILVCPNFIPQIEKIRSGKDANKRRIISNRNISIFFSHVYTALFEGEVCRAYKGDTEKIMEGRSINFHPDIIHKTRKEKKFVEVKAVSTSTSRPLCARKQFRNYCFRVLRELEKYKRVTKAEYAIFRYSLKKSPNCFDNHEFAKPLAENMKDLLIIPLNLAIFLFANSRTHVMDQSTSKGHDMSSSWKLYGKIITKLHRFPSGIIEEMVQENSDLGSYASNLLLLGGLQSKSFEAPKNLYYCGKSPINSFRITRYFNRDEKVWAERFREKHGEILEDFLGAEDLYKQVKEVEALF